MIGPGFGYDEVRADSCLFVCNRHIIPSPRGYGGWGLTARFVVIAVSARFLACMYLYAYYYTAVR